MKRIALAIAALGVASGAGASIPPAYRAHLPPAIQVGNVAFVSGGKDIEEERSLKRAAQEYPLELVFEEKDRAFDDDYIENIPVTIRDEKGDIALKAVSRGPIFLAKIPPGHYTVETKWDAWTFTRPVTIEANQRDRVVFSWWRDSSLAKSPPALG